MQCLDAVLLAVPWNSPNFELSRDVQLRVLRLVRVDRLQLLNSLLAVTVARRQTIIRRIVMSRSSPMVVCKPDMMSCAIEWHSPEAVFDVWPPKTERASPVLNQGDQGEPDTPIPDPDS